MKIDELLLNNAAYAETFDKGDLPAPPSRGIAVVTCMDARIDVHRVLGAKEGDLHVIRNAGGLATDDAIRSLVVSQRMLSTELVLVVQHTRCGMLDLPEEEIKREIERESGVSVEFELGAFTDLHQSVRSAVITIQDSPFLGGFVRGFVYDVATGRLQEVA